MTLPSYDVVRPLLPVLVQEFYQRVLRDPVLGTFFVGRDMNALEALQVAFLASLFPGGPKWEGHSLAVSHKPLGIEERHFARVAHHLGETLKHGGVDQAVSTELLALVGRLRTSIVGKPCRQLDLQAAVEPHRQRVLQHPLYEQIQSVAQLRTFMEHHVYAVWDFMSLLKALQAVLTCVDQPWVPRGEPETRRLINEIVVGEESDLVEGRIMSHFEMYLLAMDEIGADTVPVRAFVEAVQEGHLVQVALQEAKVPPAAHAFVLQTMDTVSMGRAHAIAAAFTIGREELIPGMFREVVAGLTAAGIKVKTMVAYLDRHIGLDEGEHGPLAERMLENLCGNDKAKWDEATGAAIQALRSRVALWDAIQERIEGQV